MDRSLWILSQPALSVVITITCIYYFLLLPPKYPMNISAVPLWVGLIPLFRDVDQEDMYKKHIQKPLQKHGAVKMFFAGRWHILVQKLAYVAEIFKDEETFQKRGNQKKILCSAIASFLGKHPPA